MNKRTIVVLMLAALVMTGCKDDKKPAVAEALPVRTMTVTSTTGAGGLSYPGTVEETTGTMLSFAVGGTLKSINVSTGTRVSKGQLIAVIDDATLRNSHLMAATALRQAEDAYRRMKQLHDAGSLPDIQWVDVQSKLEQARAAEAIARKSMADSRLYAPFSGVIAEKSAEAGQNVAPGMPVAKLVKIGQVKVRMSVPETDIPLIRVGQQAVVSAGALGGKTFTGRIVEKGVEANPVTRSYDVKVLLQNPSGELLPGMVCDAGIAASAGTHTAIVLPASIVQIDSNNLPFVWTVRGGMARKRIVRTGATTPGGVIVTEGLSDGDEVITQGAQKVSEGSRVVKNEY